MASLLWRCGAGAISVYQPVNDQATPGSGRQQRRLRAGQTGCGVDGHYQPDPLTPGVCRRVAGRLAGGESFKGLVAQAAVGHLGAIAHHPATGVAQQPRSSCASPSAGADRRMNRIADCKQLDEVRYWRGTSFDSKNTYDYQ